jgi:hypothetical protein
VFVEPFPSNGSFGWLNSSCLEQICHNILKMYRYTISEETARLFLTSKILTGVVVSMMKANTKKREKRNFQ